MAGLFSLLPVAWESFCEEDWFQSDLSDGKLKDWPAETGRDKAYETAKRQG